MAEIVFFTGVADRLAFAHRLLRKKYREGARVAVYAHPSVLARLDYQLWAADPLEFLPHLRLREGELPPPSLCERTQLWLLDQPQPLLRCDNAVNLGLDEPAWLSAHQRVAEVVGIDEQDRTAGRRRWRQYEAQGHVLKHQPQS
jgi:DNA polymerase-3 subunit chi